MTTAVLRVVAPGPNATIQDLGRPGWFSAGVGVSGAADTVSLRLANRLVGNTDDAAGIECVLGGLHLLTLAPVTLAVTGAPAPITVDATPVAHSSVLHLQAGEHLRLGLAQAGMRVYVGVRGGVAVEPVLGSRSRDTMAGIGPDPLQAGSELPIGPPPEAPPDVDVGPIRPITTEPVTARVAMGPRDDWFSRPADLFVGHWVVSDRLDRVGVRLDRPIGAPPLTRVNHDELPTEGMPLGAIQVPPSGEPVVFLADHPITGGYPVIGVVLAEDVPLLAQARPGQHLVFRPEGAAQYPTVTAGCRRSAGPTRPYGSGAIQAPATLPPSSWRSRWPPPPVTRRAPAQLDREESPAFRSGRRYPPFQLAHDRTPPGRKLDGHSHLQSARCQPRRNCRACHPSRQRRRLRERRRLRGTRRRRIVCAPGR